MKSEQIKTLKDRVGQILEMNPSTRNSDKELVQQVCGIYGYDPIRKASAIERCRRYWNGEGKYLPTMEEVARQRRMNIDEWRKALGYGQGALPL